ncbi:pirin family protein [Parahaliea maris]|uniref:Pirin family protein n=1 Tax=Parahaliea maris TaxID=2716870 RepID=A0A5C9A6R9_9GAMM|nr:pirin family protein [Parahaliea maris]TXS95277.1 pirin family protein [Parahaliea maris]
MNERTLTTLIPGMATSDGAGVKLQRTLGQSQGARLDPFLMLDEFSSFDAGDYIAGFPSHPHRGFETVTYMLDGHMLHEDHLGNRGDLRSGDVQWMTAGRGIIHSEMPQQNEGRMRGFQLWINLPAAEKMKPANYRDIPAQTMPWRVLAEGVEIRLIAGKLELNGEHYEGPVQGLSTEPLYVDVKLPANSNITVPVQAGHNAFFYVFEGELQVAGRDVPRHSAAILSDGDAVTLTSGAEGGRALLLAGKPIGEPVAQYGPFVMNTPDEINQALRDYRDGRLTSPAT